jgi:hypothetical protein
MRTAVADASRGRPTDRLALRADCRESESVSVRRADGVLSGTGAVGEVERESTTAGTYHGFLLGEAAQVTVRSLPEMAQ